MESQAVALRKTPPQVYFKLYLYTSIFQNKGNTGSKGNKSNKENQGNKSAENEIKDQISNELGTNIEKKLGKQEAEAILNALKANEMNLKNKQYKNSSYYKTEKDW